MKLKNEKLDPLDPNCSLQFIRFSSIRDGSRSFHVGKREWEKRRKEIYELIKHVCGSSSMEDCFKNIFPANSDTVELINSHSDFNGRII